jgi:hypothetical protein
MEETLEEKVETFIKNLNSGVFFLLFLIGFLIISITINLSIFVDECKSYSTANLVGVFSIGLSFALFNIKKNLED